MGVPAQAPVRLGVQGLTVESAIDHLVVAAQGVVQNQLELARLEMRQTADDALWRVLLVVVGAILLAGTAVALGMAAYAAMPGAMLPERRLVVVAAAVGALGLACAVAGMRRRGRHGRV